MDDIADLADVSKPMIYAYFGSKEGLYIAYIDRTGRQLLDRLGHAAPRERHPRALREPINEFLAFVEEHRDGWTVLFTELSASRPIADEIAVLRGQITDTVRSMFGSATSGPGAPPPVAIDAIAHAIVGAGESLANWWLEHPDVPRDDVAGWYVDIVHASVDTIGRNGTGLGARTRRLRAELDPGP
jgi:AcrR family transcriptional regulator